ncbi:hypothetical protein CGCF413_v010779 [Colletotrichum fructicola]|nr:hypothetical protein CGCF413_v010779 [Colletotrichum fructicola]
MSFHETNSSTSQFTHTNRPFRNAAFSEAAHTTKSAASFTSVWDLFSLDLCWPCVLCGVGVFQIRVDKNIWLREVSGIVDQFSAVSLSVDSFRPMRMSSATLASANEQAMVVPIPEPPPVNRTVLPENSSRTRDAMQTVAGWVYGGDMDSLIPDGNGCDVEASVVVLIIS